MPEVAPENGALARVDAMAAEVKPALPVLVTTTTAIVVAEAAKEEEIIAPAEDVPMLAVVEPSPEAIILPAAKPDDIAHALEDCGLVMVETNHDKAREWQPEAPPVETAPRPRRRRPAVEVVNEPLVMVETRPPV